MNGFTKNEIRDRYIFSKICDKSGYGWQADEGVYTCYDGILSAKGKNLLVELKGNDFINNPNGHIIIERKKYANIIAANVERGADVYDGLFCYLNYNNYAIIPLKKVKELCVKFRTGTERNCNDRLGCALANKVDSDDCVDYCRLLCPASTCAEKGYVYKEVYVIPVSKLFVKKTNL